MQTACERSRNESNLSITAPGYCHFHAEVIAYMFVKEIAHSLGFENTAFFTQFFKRFTGSTPQEYRKH